MVALGVLANSSGIKAAGGIVAQVLPGADEATVLALEERARAMAPVTSQIDAGASPEDLIAALAGGIAMKPRASYGVRFACRCSRARVETALLALGRDELAKIARDGEPTEAVCEFCKRRYEFSVPEVTALIERLEARG